MRLLIVIAAILPGYAFAVGSDVFAPPKDNKTIGVCKGAKVWDSKTKSCIDPNTTELDASLLYEAVRELAYAGRYSDAQAMLLAMPDQNDDRVLTYWGFTHRKLGNDELSKRYYESALDQNPDNILARSYMGQGLVDAGDLKAAQDQLDEIRARGGIGTWPETALEDAIKTGKTYDY